METTKEERQRVIFYGKEALRETVGEFYDVKIVPEIEKFFMEPETLHILDDKVLDDFDESDFFDRLLALIKRHPEIKVHLVNQMMDCTGVTFVAVLEDHGVITHFYFPKKNISFKAQFLDDEKNAQYSEILDAPWKELRESFAKS